jgi:hypothetical protein
MKLPCVCGGASLRKRYRILLRDEIAQKLADAVDVDEEMRSLFGAFSG